MLKGKKAIENSSTIKVRGTSHFNGRKIKHVGKCWQDWSLKIQIDNGLCLYWKMLQYLKKDYLLNIEQKSEKSIYSL